MESNTRRLLLLGGSGKLGTAVRRAFENDYEIVSLGRREFDAAEPSTLQPWVDRVAPDLVVNAVALSGIAACQQEPERAHAINALLPWRLARLSLERGFVLAQASSDAVFGTVRARTCVESDTLRPVGIYGHTKALGDAFVQANAPNGYVFRFSTLFGESVREDQFVERMLARVRAGERRLEIAADIITTPSYSRDVAAEMRWILDSDLAPGVYHVANEGAASLYELMCEFSKRLVLDVDVIPVSHQKFLAQAGKNLETRLASERIPALRPWREAVGAYCDRLRPAFAAHAKKARSKSRPAVVGIDLDNTVICYDELFHTLATERGYIEASTPCSKRAVRDAMFEAGLHDAWTGLQAVAYGSRLSEAKPFPGVLETLRALHARGIELRIVSHKTKVAAKPETEGGELVDLRAAAIEWLTSQRIIDPSRTGIHEGLVYFENDRAAKAERIRTLGCTHFIDDLREFLLGPTFPSGVGRFLFDPTGAGSGDAAVETLSDWDRVRERIPSRIASRRATKSAAVAYSSP